MCGMSLMWVKFNVMWVPVLATTVFSLASLVSSSPHIHINTFQMDREYHR